MTSDIFTPGSDVMKATNPRTILAISLETSGKGHSHLQSRVLSILNINPR